MYFLERFSKSRLWMRKLRITLRTDWPDSPLKRYNLKCLKSIKRFARVWEDIDGDSHCCFNFRWLYRSCFVCSPPVIKILTLTDVARSHSGRQPRRRSCQPKDIFLKPGQIRRWVFASTFWELFYPDVSIILFLKEWIRAQVFCCDYSDWMPEVFQRHFVQIGWHQPPVCLVDMYLK